MRLFRHHALISARAPRRRDHWHIPSCWRPYDRRRPGHGWGRHHSPVRRRSRTVQWRRRSLAPRRRQNLVPARPWRQCRRLPLRHSGILRPNRKRPQQSDREGRPNPPWRRVGWPSRRNYANSCLYMPSRLFPHFRFPQRLPDQTFPNRQRAMTTPVREDSWLPPCSKRVHVCSKTASGNDVSWKAR